MVHQISSQDTLLVHQMHQEHQVLQEHQKHQTRIFQTPHKHQPLGL